MERNSMPSHQPLVHTGHLSSQVYTIKSCKRDRTASTEPEYPSEPCPCCPYLAKIICKLLPKDIHLVQLPFMLTSEQNVASHCYIVLRQQGNGIYGIEKHLGF